MYATNGIPLWRSPLLPVGTVICVQALKACADYGDHSQCVHGEIQLPQFEGTYWAHPEAAAVHALHDGSWGGWGFNVESKDDHKVTFRDGGYQEQTGTGCHGQGTVRFSP
jgi:hypothetical protein